MEIKQELDRTNPPKKLRRFVNGLPFPLGDHPWWIDATTRAAEDKDTDPRVHQEQVIDILDHKGFYVQAFVVSALGFLADSYALFATNVILPLLAFLYWPDRTDSLPELYINVATLSGSVIGQLLFGWLTDRLGRRKMYGLELVLVIFATLGMAQASTGIHQNMNILSWIVFYRFFLGLGIGAEYPLSAVITAEFASTKYRARMMALVFLMQPLGQALASAIGWGVMTRLMRSRGLDNLPDQGPAFDQLPIDLQYLIMATLDSVWRWVIGAGCIPALLAILWRFSIPESPRYIMEVDDDAPKALAVTKRQLAQTVASMESQRTSSDGRENPSQPASSNIILTLSSLNSPEPLHQLPHQPQQGRTLAFCTEFYTFLKDGNWRYLAATSICWFLFDFCFYALGINSPRPLAALWASAVPNITVVTTLPTVAATITAPITQAVSISGTMYNISTSVLVKVPLPTKTMMINASATDPSFSAPNYVNIWHPTSNMFHELCYNSYVYIYTISITSLLGSAVLVLLIDYVWRKTWLVTSFLILSVLFAILGGVLVATEFHGGHWANVILYAICQFFFNLGPNPLIYIVSGNIFSTAKAPITNYFQIAAEIFPTKFRSTCHGISAASGKIGAIIITAVTQTSAIRTNPHALGILLGVFSIPLAMGALFAWVWLPNLQIKPNEPARAMRFPWLMSKSLERLGKGWKYATADSAIDPRTNLPKGESQKLGFSKKIGDLWRRKKNFEETPR
ncbi:major facilitator superfamily domain-containing protein [Penicillium taxi]|uniref:major facilitator superfamily domain-containing protein n=1 Tax=Penicillium taxi TaxID=168475 RepID=UPI002545738B|nr:major facilitator superfamily domain-containing protein [Penicillium taxi]KAJ5908475.1 major facilitator superfamily domain-containing protein [Penicillium taxi]